MRKLFIALLSALLCLLLSVSALAADGLSTFQETQTYQPGMFSDVKAGSWYEAGVRAVYTRGIMNGTGGKAFAPSQTITWAQAAAIAARIHAACGVHPLHCGAELRIHSSKVRDALIVERGQVVRAQHVGEQPCQLLTGDGR